MDLQNPLNTYIMLLFICGDHNQYFVVVVISQYTIASNNYIMNVHNNIIIRIYIQLLCIQCICIQNNDKYHYKL